MVGFLILDNTCTFYAQFSLSINIFILQKILADIVMRINPLFYALWK